MRLNISTPLREERMGVIGSRSKDKNSIHIQLDFCFNKSSGKKMFRTKSQGIYKFQISRIKS